MIGSSTYCLINHPLEQALGILSDYTNRVEVLSDGSHSLFLYEEVCYSFDLRYTVHAPCGDINPASGIETMRKASIEAIADLSLIADRICAERLVIHPGHVSGFWEMDAALAAFERSLQDLALLQDERSVLLTIENMGGWDSYIFRDTCLAQIIIEYGLGLTVDLGHAHLNGLTSEFLDLDGVIHLHLHDNCGSFDSHDACGEGTIPYPELVERFPRDASLIIETQRIDQFYRSLKYLNPFFS